MEPLYATLKVKVTGEPSGSFPEVTMKVVWVWVSVRIVYYKVNRNEGEDVSVLRKTEDFKIDSIDICLTYTVESLIKTFP